VRRASIAVIAVALTLSLSSCGASQAELDKARAEGAAQQLAQQGTYVSETEKVAAARAKAKAAAAAKAKSKPAATKPKTKSKPAATKPKAKSPSSVEGQNWHDHNLVVDTLVCDGAHTLSIIATWESRIVGQDPGGNDEYEWRNKSVVESPYFQCPNSDSQLRITSLSFEDDIDSQIAGNYVKRTYAECTYSFIVNDFGSEASFESCEKI